MRIDAHQHFWHYTSAGYSWIDDSMDVIRRDFLPESLAPLLADARLDGTVAVQARQSLEETEFLLDLARHHPAIRGVVGWAPLADSGVGELLDRWAMNPAFKGVRHVVQGESDPDFLDRPDFNAGLREVTTRQLTYDLLIYAHQLPAATAFVDRHPGQRFVLDHIAKPRVDGEPPAAWRRQLAELARRPNVSCKFSGVVTEVPGRRWTPSLLRPYFECVLAAFGPGRVLFGSDWPVCLVASDYSRWVDTCTLLTANLSSAEQARFWGGNATDFYRLHI